MKYFKSFLVLILIMTEYTTMFFAIKSANFFNNKVLNNLNLKKIIFSEKEWKSFINKDGNIDQELFKCIFLLKMESQKYLENINFNFEKNKVEVNIWDNYTHYKWFYKLEKL